MIQIAKDHIIIKLNHVCPEDAVRDLQTGIIDAIIYQFEHTDEIPITDQLREGNCMLLELLKATLEEER